MKEYLVTITSQRTIQAESPRAAITIVKERLKKFEGDPETEQSAGLNNDSDFDVECLTD